MTKNKELYTEHGEKWIMETNDFWYYMHLKKQKVPTKYTGNKDKLLTLWRDLTDYLRKEIDMDMCPCETSPNKQNYDD